MASTPSGPGRSWIRQPRSAGPTPRRAPAKPASSSSQAPSVCGSGTRRPPGRTGPANAMSRSTPKPRRSPASPGPNRTPGAAPSPTTTTTSGSTDSMRATASAHARRSSVVSGAARPSTPGSSSGGVGQNATATVAAAGRAGGPGRSAVTGAVSRMRRGTLPDVSSTDNPLWGAQQASPPIVENQDAGSTEAVNEAPTVPEAVTAEAGTPASPSPADAELADPTADPADPAAEPETPVGRHAAPVAEPEPPVAPQDASGGRHVARAE